MLTLMAVVLAALFLVGTIALALFQPHTATYLAAFAWAVIFFALILPKYLNEQKALTHGEDISAKVERIRQWDDHGDGVVGVSYAIEAVWVNPRNGKPEKFISNTLRRDPTPYIKNNEVKIRVNPNNTKQYVFDLTFMPK